MGKKSPLGDSSLRTHRHDFAKYCKKHWKYVIFASKIQYSHVARGAPPKPLPLALRPNRRLDVMKNCWVQPVKKRTAPAVGRIREAGEPLSDEELGTAEEEEAKRQKNAAALRAALG